MASGTTFDIDIDANAGSVEPAAASLARLTERLTSAGAASLAAAEALKAGSAAYAQAEAAADRAAKALEKINVMAGAQSGKLKAALEVGDIPGADRASAKLTALTMRQLEAAQKADQTKAALASEAAALDKLKAAAEGAAAQEAKLSKAQDSLGKAAASTEKLKAATGGTGKVNEMAEAFGKLGGPVGALGQKAFGAAEGVKKLFASMGTAVGATAGVVLVVAALTAALVAGAAAILKYAITNSDAARTAGLLSAGIEGTVAGGALLNDKISELSKRLPKSRDELRSMAADLAKSGLKGQALADALEDAAVKSSKLKFGPEFADETNSLANLARRLTDNLGDIFKLKTGPLLAGLGKLVDLFDSTSVTGNAIKVVFDSLFQPLIDALIGLVPVFISTFIQFEIWVLKALIAIKPFGSTILSVAKWVGIAALVIVAALAVAILVIVAMAVAAALLVAGLVWLVVTLSDLGVQFGTFVKSVITGAIAAFDGIVAKVTAVIDYLSGLSLGEIGTMLIDGLAAGLTAGGAAVLSAITGVVGGAIDAAKGLLGIASPSAVFAEIGANTGAGMAGGVEGATGSVQGALETMVSPPVAEAASGAGAAAGAGGGSGASLNLAGATFTFNGVEGAEDAEARFAGVLTRLLEGDAAQGGVEVPA